MIKRYLFLMLTALAILASPAYATTRYPATCSSTNVMAAIADSSTGDTVHLPTGATCNWAAGSVTLAKAITIEGDGEANTIINVSGTDGLVTFQITKQAAGLTWIKDLTFLTNSTTTEIVPIAINGSWLSARPVIFSHVTFTNSFATTLGIHTPGGVILSYITFNGTQPNDFLMAIDDNSNGPGASWTTVDSMGTNDTTGEMNVYVENSTFNGGANGVVDCTNDCRLVMRYNHFFQSAGYNSHGWDTAPYGTRHFEIYENDFHYSGSCAAIDNVQFFFWVRGGTGVIFNNSMDNITGCWGDKFEGLFTVRAIQDSIANVYGATAAATCVGITYPVPHGIGVNYNGTSQFVDPVYLWGNTGTLQAWHDNFSYGNPCSLSYDTYFLADRDWKYATKPSYTAYTYPHPLISGVAVSCAPDHLAFTSQPVGGYYATFLGTVTVGIYDANNALCTSSTSTVTISNKGGTCAGMTLFGTTSGAATSGLFTTTNLAYNAAGSCTLNASVSGLPNEASSAFTVYNPLVGPGIRLRRRNP